VVPAGEGCAEPADVPDCRSIERQASTAHTGGGAADGRTRRPATALRRRSREPPAERALSSLGRGAADDSRALHQNVQIVQTRDYILIHNEMMHDVRVIPLDGRRRLPRQIRQWKGDSRGRWDGDTLVVDTTNFTDKTTLNGSDAALHVVERLTRVDAKTMRYEFTVDDPRAFTRSWSAALSLRATDDRIFEYACHEANYSIVGILRGARAADKRR
jgi:hypothetical protein